MVLELPKIKSKLFSDSKDLDRGVTGDKSIKEEKILFIYPVNPSPDSNVGAYPVVNLDSTEQCFFAFNIPTDFNAISTIAIVVIPDATETIQWDLSTDYGSVGQNSDDNAGDFEDNTQDVTAFKITELPIVNGFENIKAGDYGSVLFASDTTQIRVFGLRIRYT